MKKNSALIYFLLGLFGMTVSIFYFSLPHNIFSKPQLIANITSDRTVVKPLGLAGRQIKPQETRDKVTFTLTYANTTDKPLARARLEIHERQTTYNRNFHIFPGKDLGRYTKYSPELGTYIIPDLPAHATKTVQFYIVAQEKGSSQFDFQVKTTIINMKAGTISITAE